MPCTFFTFSSGKLDIFMVLHYTCQLFLRYKREIFILAVPGIFEHDTIISEDSRRSPKTSEEVRRLPKSSEVLARV